MIPIQCRSTAALVATFALAALTGCAGEPEGSSPAKALREAFPEQAAAILDGPRAQDLEGEGKGEGMTLPPREAPEGVTGVTSLRAQFPRTGAEAVQFEVPGGRRIQVLEIGAHGPVEPAGAAITYARTGGTSFWTRTARGYEEWLLLKAGIACSGAEVAAWEVSGAALEQRGTAIHVLDAEGHGAIRVTAPKAYAAGGRPVEVKLSARGQRISIEVDAGCEAVLVDPAWELIEPMLGARSGHTEARLLDGRVLIIGGLDAAGLAKVTTEIWTPATGAWIAAAPMATARAGHASTLLDDGRVLVAGGSFNGSLASVEIYDPQANVWTPAAPMKQARALHTVTRLADGQVLAAGGVAGLALSSAEIYNPATDTWTALPPMSTSRYWHTATLLLDGRVLIWGAAGTDLFPTENVPFDLFDPASMTWSSTLFAEATRQRHTATLLPNGDVLIAGGEINGMLLTSAQLFQPGSNERNFITPMLTERTTHTATLLDDGNVLVTGGFTSNGATTSTEIYYAQNDRWSFSAELNQARFNHTATRLLDTRVLVTGGKAVIATLTSSEIFGSALGEPCATVKDCPSGHCIDGVCCDAACDIGQCDACSIATGASQDGHCEILMDAPCEDGMLCTTGDKCDALGVCQTGAPVVCGGSTECLNQECYPATGACIEVAKDNGLACSLGICSEGVCVELPDMGAGGAGGAGGGAGSGGAPVVAQPIYVQGGSCFCSTPTSAPGPARGFGVALITALLLGLTRRTQRRTLFLTKSSACTSRSPGGHRGSRPSRGTSACSASARPRRPWGCRAWPR